jgi:8-oxo-dGTP diphosphatase
MLYLVRHAKAGSRSDWHDDDELRPLSKAGRRQSSALAAKLAKRSVTALVSSPYVRCVQTLEPLAVVCRQPVVADERLSEGNDFVGALELLTSLPDGAVLCSHGDIIPATIDALARRGCRIASPPEFRKASVWVIERTADGEFAKAKVWLPPE